MIKTILWDFDGTLVDTNSVIIESWQATYRHYLGIEKSEDYIKMFFGEPLLITLEREIPGVDPEESAEYYRACQKDRAAELVKVIEGIPEALEYLSKKGYRHCIVTSRTRETTLRYLDMFDMGKYFEDMVCTEDTNIHKPEAEPILLALKKMRAEKSEAVMIGDGVFDVKSANNAGVISILVGWRATSDAPPLIEDAKEDYEVATVEELVSLLEKL